MLRDELGRIRGGRVVLWLSVLSFVAVGAGAGDIKTSCSSHSS